MKTKFTKNLLSKITRLQRSCFMAVFLLIFLLSSSSTWGQVTTIQNWTNIHNSTGNYNSSYSVPSGSNSNRMLVVAVATSTQTASTRTITVTYGGLSPTSSVGDMNLSSIQNTQLFFFDESKLDAASGNSLEISFSGGTATLNTVYAAVFDNVYQSNPFTDSKNYNSNTSQVDPVVLGTALTIGVGDQAVAIISTVRIGSTTNRSISSYPLNWANAGGELTGSYDPSNTGNDQGIRNAIATRSIPSSSTTDLVSVDLNGTARASMTAVSLKSNTESVLITTSGTYIVPSCVTSLTVEAWGGGGGGFDGSNSGGGKGGGGGGYARSVINNPSAFYNITVGSGGAEDSNGTASVFGSNLVVAAGGFGGTSATTGGGAGGTSNTGQVTRNGGSGGNGNGSDDVGGGGGGAGGPDGNGVSGSNGESSLGGNGGRGNNNLGGAGGTGGNGGNGSNGSNNNLGGGGGGGGDNGTNGGNGGFPGGGGGGGENNGGIGGNGLVKITYTLPAKPTITLTNSTVSVCYSASAQNVTLPYTATTSCPDKYSLDFGSGITDVNNANLSGSPITIALPAGLSAGTYTGTLIVTNSNYNFQSSGIEISIVVNSPNTGILSGTQEVCLNGSTTLTSTVSGGTWSSSNPGVATIDNSTGEVTGISAGTVTMSYTVTDINGCSTTATLIVTVNSIPTNVTAGASESIICLGDSVDLSASASSSTITTTVLSENFNSTPTGWVTNNASSGGTPVNAAWALRANGYNVCPTGCSASQTLNSNDASQFYLSDSDRQGSGGTTNTTLTSPPFSTVNMTEATLSFYQFYRDYDSNDSATVEISTNNGANWTILETYTTSQGANNNFALKTINLSSYLGISSVVIRFKYNSAWGYYWAIDNVTVSGSMSNTPTFAWTSNPPGFNSTEQNPTNVIPSETTTYTLTATNSFGCTTTATTTVTVNIPSVAPTTITGTTTICNGGSTTLTAAGGTLGTGANYQWGTGTNIGSNIIAGETSASITVSPLSSTTYWVRITNGSAPCSHTTTGIFQEVTVNPTSVAGTVSADQTICSGQSPTPISLTGNTGTVQWQVSTDNSSFSNISGATSSPLTSAQMGTLTATRYYRAVVTSGVCSSVNSPVVTVTVNPTSVAGTVSANQTICSGQSPTPISLTGNTGTIQWQVSTDNSSFSNISGATSTSLTSAQMGTLTATRYYRAVVTSGVCSSVNSPVVTVTVNPIVAPSFIPVAAICSGATLSALPTTSTNGISGTWSPALNNTSTTTYTFTPAEGQCASTASMTITVNPLLEPSVVIAVSPSNTFCTGDSVTFTATPSNGGTNPTYQWKLNGTNIPGANSATFTSSTLTNGQIISVEMTSDAACVTTATALSNGITTIVNTPIGIDAITPANSAISTIETTTITATGVVGTGAIVSWYDANNPTVLLGTGLTSPQVGPGTYIAVVSGACGSAIQLTTTIAPLYSWTGATNNRWDNQNNWAEGVVPTAETAVVITGTASNQPEVSGDNNFAGSITLLDNAVLTMKQNANLTVTNAISVASTAQFIVEDKANMAQINPNAVNTGTVKVRRSTRGLRRLDYVLFSSPTNGNQTLKQFSPGTVDNRFYFYNSMTNAYNVVSNVQTPFETGKGYLIRTANNHPTTPAVWNVEYQGVPNNGTITQQMASPRVGDQNRYFLVGNPYTSSINIMSFIEANEANIAGIVYIWRKTNGTQISGYSSIKRNPNNQIEFTPNGFEGAENPGTCIPSGQGFIVEMKEGASQVLFTNAMRTLNGNAVFNRMNQQTNSTPSSDEFTVKLARENGEFTFASLGYYPNASNEYEVSYDVQSMSDAALSIASLVDQKRIVSQSRANFETTDVVPLSLIINTAGNYQLTLESVNGLFAANQNVYVLDNTTSAFHNLSAGPYSFVSEAGTFADRFEIRYEESTLSVTNPVFNENQVVVYKTSSNELSVNTGSFMMSNVKIFDISGKLIVDKNGIDASQTLITLATTPEILLVKITSDTGVVVTKKVLFPRTSLKLNKKVDMKIQVAEDE